ncbi:nucleoside 2-deoxyribosyltransferase [uncultured Megamonas sp.]|uniref:nucleoside 2-deoxyribosyltransferase n=1 Tax=uncultured Megamonas sp. TaxID=286140 RepID=UPI00259BF38D|nr:nucleoside 2-deoxyribosyltransferase [uncultured Megamonas sp.]
MSKVKVYCACSWFDQEQTKHMKNVYKALKENKTCDWDNSYRPLDHQYKGIAVDENPEFLDDEYQRAAWIANTYKNDISGIINSNVGVFAYVPGQETIDDGMAFELGYMTAMGKPTIVVIPDDKGQEPMNLMIAEGATQVVTLSEFHNMDLTKVFNKPFDKVVF